MDIDIRGPRRDGSKVVAHARVDDVDAWVDEYDWREMKGRKGHQPYAATRHEGQTLLMHRLILGLEVGNPLQADHINHDKLDNRRRNLRAVTPSQNSQNREGANRGSTSEHRGVTWHKGDRMWQAQGMMEGKYAYIGSFHTEEEAGEAARAWRESAMTHAS